MRSVSEYIPCGDHSNKDIPYHGVIAVLGHYCNDDIRRYGESEDEFARQRDMYMQRRCHMLSEVSILCIVITASQI